MDKKEFIVWASTHQSGYEPTEEIKKKIASIDLIAIVGPTGVGKTSIIEQLELPFIMSDVSRDRRPDEKNDVNYHFRSDYLGMFKDIKQGAYVQYLVTPSGEFYGTRGSAYPDSGKCTMAVVAEQIPHFREMGFRSVQCIYIMPPSYVEWMRRIGGVRTKDLLSRISEARNSITLAINDGDYTFVLNDTLDLAVDDVKSLIRGEQIDGHRAQLAFDTADILLKRIGEDTE